MAARSPCGRERGAIGLAASEILHRQCHPKVLMKVAACSNRERGQGRQTVCTHKLTEE